MGMDNTFKVAYGDSHWILIFSLFFLNDFGQDIILKHGNEQHMISKQNIKYIITSIC